MTQQLGTSAALAEASGLVASANVQPSTTCNSRSRGPPSSFLASAAPGTHVKIVLVSQVVI